MTSIQPVWVVIVVPPESHRGQGWDLGGIYRTLSSVSESRLDHCCPLPVRLLLKTKIECQLRIFLAVRIEFLVEKTGLDVVIVLILFALVLRNVTLDFVIENLANGDARIDSDRLYGKHLDGPEAAEPDIAKAGGHMNEKSQASDGRTPFDHGYQIMGGRVLNGSSQVKLVGSQDKSLGGNRYPADTIRESHIQHNLFVGQELVVQRQVVAVGIEVVFIKRIDVNVGIQLRPDFVT